MDVIAQDPWQFIGVYRAADYLVYYYFNRALTKQFNEITVPAVEEGGWWVWVKNIGNQTLKDCGVFFDNEPSGR